MLRKIISYCISYTGHLASYFMRNEALLCLASAVLLILSFPNFDFSFLVWVAFIPLFFAIQNKKPSRAFFVGYITGAFFYLGSIYWLIHVTLVGYILLSAYLALYFGLFAFLLNYKLYAMGYRLLFVPALWVALEYIRTTFITGFGWMLLGYSQYKNLSIIQMIDITGPYGVSFFIVMVNVVAYQLITSAAVRRISTTEAQAIIRRVLCAALIFLFVLYYGYLKLEEKHSGESVRISVVQGNIPQYQKWDNSYANYIFNKYEVMTMEAASTMPDLIIWPETSFPDYFGIESEITLVI